MKAITVAAAALCAVLFLATAAAQAGDRLAALPMTPAPPGALSGEQMASSFCGACTTSDDCGKGWVCCSRGCSGDQKKCYEAVSCDQVRGADGWDSRALALRRMRSGQ